eukprot:491383-Rhodomonas_salina.1
MAALALSVSGIVMRNTMRQRIKIDNTYSKGNTNFVVLMGMLQWESKHQKVTALSSAESEFYAASACGCEIFYLQQVMSAMGFDQEGQTPVAEDNIACIYMSKSSAMFNKAELTTSPSGLLSHQCLGRSRRAWTTTTGCLWSLRTKALSWFFGDHSSTCTAVPSQGSFRSLHKHANLCVGWTAK